MSISPADSRGIVLKIFIILLLPLILLPSCGKRGGSSDRRDLDWRLEHYWDSISPTALDAGEIEQHLVNYIYLSMNASTDRRRLCWQAIARTFPDEQPNRLVSDYLGEPDSPLYAPAMLEEYLEAISELYEQESLERYRIDYLLEGIRKNKSGMKIADIDLLSASGGRRVSLHSLITMSETDCYVLFYDPDCEECAAMISSLAADPEAANVVAVSVTAEARDLPPGWHSFIAADASQLDERFFLPRLPQLYITLPNLTIK